MDVSDAKVDIQTERLPPIDGTSLTRIEAVLRAQDAPPGMAAFCVRVEGLDGFACTYKPHLSPLPDMVVGEKAFRCPAIIMESAAETVALIPDLRVLEQPHPYPLLMDWACDTSLYFGVGPQRATRHVYYELTGEPMRPQESVRLSFYLMRAPRDGAATRDFRPVQDVLWALYGRRMAENPPDPHGLLAYARHVYTWAFDRWKDVCWQEFTLGGVPVGGVVFIVTARQKPGLGREDVWREPKSLWNQAWFCGLRSAYGYKRFGQTTGDAALERKADLALNFALAAPMRDGLFASYYEAGADGGWGSGRWVFSTPRRPDGHEAYAHLLDNSWTCYWLLKWYRDIEPRGDILRYVRAYVRRLLALQRPDGGYPAWVRPEDGHCSPYLTISPESAAHVMLLSELYAIEPEPALLASMERTAAFLMREIIPNGRWEDFETYWSCAPEWAHKRHGKTDPRSGLYSQCTFGMYWTAEALLRVYRLAGDAACLDAGERVLAELSLYQQVCRPHGFVPETLGGFGVMNCDDEWNDARQSLFALTYLRYYETTKNDTYRLRALWSLRASFYMMYCPENPEVKALYEAVHPQLTAEDYGFHMENYNHGDGTASNGLGEFTIFDWGNGAACASLIEYLDMTRD